MKNVRMTNAKLLGERLAERQKDQLEELIATTLLAMEEVEPEPEPVDEYVECCPEALKKQIKRNKNIWKSHESQLQCLCSLDVKCEFVNAGCPDIYEKLKTIKERQAKIALAHIHWAEYCYHECLCAGMEDEMHNCKDDLSTIVGDSEFEIEIQEWIDLIVPDLGE